MHELLPHSSTWKLRLRVYHFKGLDIQANAFLGLN